jgi:hypothetical protein
MKSFTRKSQQGKIGYEIGIYMLGVYYSKEILTLPDKKRRGQETTKGTEKKDKDLGIDE